MVHIAAPFNPSKCLMPCNEQLIITVEQNRAKAINMPMKKRNSIYCNISKLWANELKSNLVGASMVHFYLNCKRKEILRLQFSLVI